MFNETNLILVEGNIGEDVKLEMKDEDTTMVVKFSVAQYTGAKHKDTGKNVARWHTIRIRSKVQTNNKVETPAQYAIDNLKKGDRVLIAGRLVYWMPESEYEKETKWNGYRATPAEYIDVTSVKKVEKPKTQEATSNRTEMPPF
jgi:single-stranded DNA-binding protein